MNIEGEHHHHHPYPPGAFFQRFFAVMDWEAMSTLPWLAVDSPRPLPGELFHHVVHFGACKASVSANHFARQCFSDVRMTKVRSEPG